MNKKRLTAGAAAVCLSLTLCLPISAAGGGASLEEASQVVSALGILAAGLLLLRPQLERPCGARKGGAAL